MDWSLLREVLQVIGAAVGGAIGIFKVVPYMLSLRYKVNKTWPLKIIVIAVTPTWNERTGGAVVYLDVSYSLEPRVVSCVVQAVGIEYEGDWFNGTKPVPMTETLDRGWFPAGEQINAATPPYKSRFVIEQIPENRNQVLIKPTIVVGARGRSCKARMGDVAVTRG